MAHSWRRSDLSRNADTYFDVEGTQPHPLEFHEYLFTLLSRVLKMTFDVRDMGFLVIDPDNTRAVDSEWRKYSQQLITRLASKLHAFSLHCIAGLNLEACCNWPSGKWVRAFGVSPAILRASDTMLTKEWRFVKGVPSDDAIARVSVVHNEIGTELHTLCLNIIAMFGLFHLNKNHTFKTGDANMERICNSFIMMLQIMVPVAVIDDMKAHMEVICRTAAHPFGLGQTYWTALLMAKVLALTSPLVRRIDASLPAVTRYHIVDVAMKEWSGFPVRDRMKALFSETLEIVSIQVAKIKAMSPAYSELYLLYSLNEPGRFDEIAKDVADSLMHVFCGYSRATHVTKDNKKDGLGYALSLENVDRTAKVVAASYENMWKSYVDAMDIGGLEEFVKNSFESRYGHCVR